MLCGIGLPLVIAISKQYYTQTTEGKQKYRHCKQPIHVMSNCAEAAQGV